MVTTPVFLSNSNEDMRSYDNTLCDIVSFTGNIARKATVFMLHLVTNATIVGYTGAVRCENGQIRTVPVRSPWNRTVAVNFFEHFHTSYDES